MYFHFPSKAALGQAVVDETHASWSDVATRIALRDLDALQTLLILYDAQVARLTHDPVVRGGLRVIREEPGMQAGRRLWVEAWRAESQRLLEVARDQDLLRPEAHPAEISGTLLATVIGHQQLAETEPEGPDAWDRMTSTWLGLLPAISSTAWLRSWSESNWSHRPAPTAEQYEHARRPEATPSMPHDDQLAPSHEHRRARPGPRTRAP